MAFRLSRQSSKRGPLQNSDSLEYRLRQIIRRGHVMTSPVQMAGYDADGLGYKRFRPDAVVIPADCAELHALMLASDRFDLPIIVRGAGTSLSGGPVAAQGGIIVHTSTLRSINHICPEGLWCEVESGVTLRQLDNALVEHGLFYPPDPSSGMVCTLGGNVAMNAGGAHCFRYGVTGNYVLGVEAVLLDGSIHRFGGPAGGRGTWREDWKRLMVGSEGTLGSFTRFWLRLLPRPEKTWTFRAAFADLRSAESAIHALVGHPSFPVAIELMDPRCVALVENSPMAVGLPPGAFLLITEIDGPCELVDSRVDSVAKLLADANATEVDYSDDSDVRQRLWRARKAAGGLMGQMSADLVVQDAVIPKSALSETLQLIYREADAASIPVINVFHAGDGNLHPNFIFDSRKPGELQRIEQINKTLMKWVIDVGGTLSGEHGIGNDKMEYMPMVFGTEGLRLQLAVGATFNPVHQLNPLKVFSSRRFDSAPSKESKQSSFNTNEVPAVAERLFSHFIDSLDAVACVGANSMPFDLAAKFSKSGLRLPLLFDPQATLDEHVLVSNYSPASSRFGGWCDNIVGVNWQLPTGQIVRLGERVVKSTTGYDLLKFFLGSGNRFGRAVDYVIRLRPAAENSRTFIIDGTAPGLKAFVSDVTQSDWTHWFDSIDWMIDRRQSGIGETSTHLRLVAHLPDNELDIAQRYVERIALQHGVDMNYHHSTHAVDDRLADLVLKATPDKASSLAERIAATFSLRCVASCCVGAVWIYLDNVAMAEKVSQMYCKQVEESGGEWSSRWGNVTPISAVEDQWISSFLAAARIL
ncbi:MAG TPA: hypothetical protein DDZ51_10930 [Planctomycetaceae bacterium]|nr:hypothetical protein [Planctomycetaceae bacterium]